MRSLQPAFHGLCRAWDLAKAWQQRQEKKESPGETEPERDQPRISRQTFVRRRKMDAEKAIKAT
jgi:hypothetical protein